MLVDLLKSSFIDDNLSLIIVISIVSVIIYIVTRVFYWVVFRKASINPVLSIVPILNYIKLIEMAELPSKTVILLFIPVANIIAICRIKYEVSIRFGKGLGFSFVYVLCPVVALYFLLQANVVYKKLNYEEEKMLLNPEGDDSTSDMLKDFKPEIKPGAVPFEENAKPYFEEKKIDLNIELKTYELGGKSEDDSNAMESKKELVTVNSNENVVEQASKVEVDLNPNFDSGNSIGIVDASNSVNNVQNVQKKIVQNVE